MVVGFIPVLSGLVMGTVVLVGDLHVAGLVLVVVGPVGRYAVACRLAMLVPRVGGCSLYTLSRGICGVSSSQFLQKKFL